MLSALQGLDWNRQELDLACREPFWETLPSRVTEGTPCCSIRAAATAAGRRPHATFQDQGAQSCICPLLEAHCRGSVLACAEALVTQRTLAVPGDDKSPKRAQHGTLVPVVKAQQVGWDCDVPCSMERDRASS